MTTQADVVRSFTLYVVELERVTGVPMGTYSLHHGSPSLGRAWRVQHWGGQAAPGTGDRGWIGNSRREACLTLDAMARILRDAAETAGPRGSARVFGGGQ
jgi:hypothetical protein